MTIRMLIAMSAVGLLLTAGCATAPDKPTMKEENATAAAQPTPDLSTRETITATATVQAIDLQTREVTLKDQNGQVRSCRQTDEAQGRKASKIR